ncbi:hypothetical protein ACOBQX_22640 [Actinokineospora sp. G85]|uniref:hypothetical protein n=1 Tax=Actinokineospora sp. G85 TaxID=3406626 RepID=UPI003C728FF7
MRVPRPIAAVLRLVDRFEERGTHAPGAEDRVDNRPVVPWRDFGWLIAAWLVGVGVFVLFFAFAS